MSQTEEAIVLLEKILKPLDACEPQCKLSLNPEEIRKVITLLRKAQEPECKECGGDKETLFEVFEDDGKKVYVCEYCRDHFCSLCKKCGTYIFNGLCRRLDDCIKCSEDHIALLRKEQPPAGEYPDLEFTKVQRKAAQLAADAYEEDEEWCPTKISRLLEACDRLDASEAKVKELLETLEEASSDFYYIHQHPEDAYTDSYKFMEKIKQTKAKKEG